MEIVLALPRPESSKRMYKQQSYPEPRILRSGNPVSFVSSDMLEKLFIHFYDVIETLSSAPVTFF